MIRFNLHNNVLTGAVKRLLWSSMQVGLIYIAMLLFSACAKEHTASEPCRQELVPVNIGLDYPVLTTKGQAINDLTFLSTHKFGILALGDPRCELPVLLRRDALTDVSGDVQLLDVDGVPEAVYYPVHSTNNYTFYGYYVGDNVPYASVGRLGEEYGIKIPDYGKVDIIYAKAEAKPIYPDGSSEPLNGFNSEYIRALNRMQIDDALYMPKLHFEHLCTRINFVVSYEDASLDPEKQVYVSRISAMNVNYSARLMLTSGRIETMTKDRIYYQTSRWVNGYGSDFSDVNFFLKPGDVDDMYFDIQVNYSRDVSPMHATISKEQIRNVLDASGVDSFKAGSRYTFDVVLRKDGYVYSTEVSAHKE